MRTDTFGLFVLVLVASLGVAVLATAPVATDASAVAGDIDGLLTFGARVVVFLAIAGGAGAVIGGLT
jgi:hypothetical protein